MGRGWGLGGGIQGGFNKRQGNLKKAKKDGLGMGLRRKNGKVKKRLGTKTSQGWVKLSGADREKKCIKLAW